MNANRVCPFLAPTSSTLVRPLLTLAFGALLSAAAVLCQTASTPPPSTDKSAPAKAEARAQATPPRTTKDRAWQTLRDGLEETNADKRAKAVNALGLLTGNAEAEKAATKALKDDKFQVRVAAATALGSMHATRAAEDLEKSLDDPEPTVVLAAANSLMTMKDASSAYDIYYGVLTGGMRTNRGLVQEQLKTLRDRKRLTELGLQEGVGFVPFGGVTYAAVKTVMKGDQSVFRAEAAKKLAHDPDPVSAEALVAATMDKSTLVRVAAVQALSERGDKSQLPSVMMALNDEKDEVRYTAAAAVIHLSEFQPAPKRKTANASNKVPAQTGSGVNPPAD
jgi:HEAT repeat protein